MGFGPASAQPPTNPDKMEPSPLVKKLPMVRRSGNTASDMEAQLERDALIDLLNLAHNYPTEVDHMARYFRDRVKKLYHQANQKESFDAISTIGKLDEVWVTSFISSQSDLSVEQVARCKSHDTDALRQMMQFMVVSSQMMKLPLQCIDTVVCNLALAYRVTECGSRMEKAKVNAA